MDQTFYVKQLQESDKDSTFNDFRSMRMKIAWLSNSRPELLFEISQPALVTLVLVNMVQTLLMPKRRLEVATLNGLSVCGLGLVLNREVWQIELLHPHLQVDVINIKCKLLRV